MEQARRIALRAIRIVLAAAAVAALQVGDGVHFNAAERASAAHRYSLVWWEAGNLLDKWSHRLAGLLPWSDGLRGRAALEEYFELTREVDRLTREVGRLAADPAHPAHDHAAIAGIEAELAMAKSARSAVRGEAEEAIESTVSAVLSELGLGSLGPLDYPPVDIRLDDPPSVVVTSPRQVIRRSDEALVVPGLAVVEREEIEDAILEDAGLSALVSDIGGVATYPAIVSAGVPLRHALETTAHEWLHHYLVAHMRPLGLQALVSDEMLTINETLASIFGREVGDMAFAKLGGVVEPPVQPGPAAESSESNERPFDFNKRMRETRLRVDGLLAEGEVEEAERYMEERRKLFVENGYYLRKINQAYFAFAGSYAEQPQSSSPVGRMMRDVRAAIPDLKLFVSAVSAVSSPDEFRALAADLAGTGPLP